MTEYLLLSIVYMVIFFLVGIILRDAHGTEASIFFYFSAIVALLSEICIILILWK